MKTVRIEDLRSGLVSGVDIRLPTREGVHREAYFEWEVSPFRTAFMTSNVVGGLLTVWHHVPCFTEVEYHGDCEKFFFLSGTVLMLFADLKAGVVVPQSLQIVRIQAGTHLVIFPGKAHFIPVAETIDPALLLIVAPTMEAPRIALSAPVLGVDEA